MNACVLLGLVVLAGAACGQLGQTRPACTPSSACRLDGDLVFNRRAGVLRLELAPDACTMAAILPDQGEHGLACTPYPRKVWTQVTLQSPWHDEIPVSESGPDWIAFKIDFSHADVDPLAARVDEQLERGWTIIAHDTYQQRIWFPEARDRAAMIPLIAEATRTEITVSEVNQPPTLVVQDFHNESELRNGGASVLTLTVVNNGEGAAYRVFATTRSNVPALHGLQFSFGRLQPREAKTRRVKVVLPRDNDETEALVVLVFDEAHQFAPESSSRRFAVRPAVDAPQLSMTCKLAGSDAPRPHVDAGQAVHVACEVRNDGPKAHNVKVSARLSGDSTPVTAAPFDLDSGKQTSVALALRVPRSAALDSELTLTVHASAGAGAGSESQVSLPLVVARPKICPDGKLTREQFAKKRAELRKKYEAQLISKEDLDAYETELVGCLE